MSILRNWELHGIGSFNLTGEVYGDERFGNGELIRTSRIKTIHFGKDKIIAETKNSIYELQNMNEKP